MKFAASNIALPAYDHVRELSQLHQMGLEGIEVAPSRVWRDTWKGLSATDVNTYRRHVENADLKVIGLHSLFFDQPNLSMFGDRNTQAGTLDFMVHLSKLCRDLGGRTLVYGGGRQRGEIPEEEAFNRAIDFCGKLCERIKAHGTCYCFEPLGLHKMDFINSVYDSLRIVKAVNSPALQVQLDAEALADNDEISKKTFIDARPYLVHVHANEPFFEILGSSGQVDHAAIGSHLRAIGYEGFVSIEQKMLSDQEPLSDLAKSITVLSASYH